MSVQLFALGNFATHAARILSIPDTVHRIIDSMASAEHSHEGEIIQGPHRIEEVSYSEFECGQHESSCRMWDAKRCMSSGIVAVAATRQVHDVTGL